MDVYIYPEDVPHVLNEVKRHLEADTIYINGSWLSKGTQEYANGDYDRALFNETDPGYADVFAPFSLRSVYEALVLLKKHKIPGKDIPYKDMNSKQTLHEDTKVINVGKLIDQRKEVQEKIETAKLAEATAGSERLAERIREMFPQLLIHDNLRRTIAGKIYQGYGSFSIQVEAAIHNEKLKVDLQIQKKDNQFGVAGYDASVIGIKEIVPGVINGIDVKHLEDRMKKADWYYGIAETAQKYTEGFREVSKIESALEKISKDYNGSIIALSLWNNYVPPNTMSKPNWLSEVQKTNPDLYTSRKFTSEATLVEAYNSLKMLNEHLQNNHSPVDQSTNNVPSLLMAGDTGEIIIADDQLHAMKPLLEEQNSQGNKWIAFDERRPVIEPHDLNFFKTDFEVAEFVHENATDLDFFASMHITALKRQVDQWERIRSNPELLIKMLEDKIVNADWNYKHADIYEQYFRGEKEVDQINYLLRIVKNECGLERAQNIWDTCLPEAAVIKPQFLTNNDNIMTEQELSRNKREFGLIGASEAFDGSLVKQMNDGVKDIRHHYRNTNEHTGDQAEAVFNVKKSDTSNLYFLNSWELSVKPSGTGPEVKKTFYNNVLDRIRRVLKNPDKHVTTFTFRSSVNYLCGRPVLNSYTNQNGSHYKAWDQAYPQEKLFNGKMKERTFHPNYGFDFREVAKQYGGAIKDLANPEHAERFFQSIERGNFQSAKFVEKNGEEDKYRVTPNIPAGYLEVYPKDGNRLTPEQQAEKGFISTEFAQTVRARLNQIEADRQNHKYDHTKVARSSENVNKPDSQNNRTEKHEKRTPKVKSENTKPKRTRRNKLR